MDGQQFLTVENLRAVEAELRQFRQTAKVRAAYLVDRNGQLMGQSGDSGLDTTALAALTASNVAASQAIAEIMGEPEFTGSFQEGRNENLYIAIVGTTGILVVVFDAQTSVGLVRLRVRKTAARLDALFISAAAETPDEDMLSPFAEITEEDIDQLFR